MRLVCGEHCMHRFIAADASETCSGRCRRERREIEVAQVGKL
jgi:hypothetical protein